MKKCLKSISFVEEVSVKQESILSLYTKKQMITIREGNARDSSTDKMSCGRLSGGRNNANDKPSINQLHHLQKHSIKVWSSARHLKLNLMAYNNLMKSKVPGLFKLSSLKPKTSLRVLVDKVINPLSYRISLKKLKLDISLPQADEIEDVDNFHCDWRVYQ